jgi:RNA polymerase sigma factor (sigma-70 family)
LDPFIAIIDNRKWLWSVVYARLGDANLTDDILQDVFVAACKSKENWPEIRQIRGWLYQIAVRQVLQFQRREIRQRRLIERYSSMKPADGDPSLLDRFCGSEQVDTVRTALWLLRPSDRQVLLLKYGDELSCRDIATHMGVTETTVQTRLLRARRHLRGLLTKTHVYERESK